MSPEAKAAIISVIVTIVGIVASRAYYAGVSDEKLEGFKLETVKNLDLLWGELRRETTARMGYEKEAQARREAFILQLADLAKVVAVKENQYGTIIERLDKIDQRLESLG